MKPTRENDVLDLVIVSQDHLINNVTVGEHICSCDHKVVRAEINTTSNVAENKIFVPNFRRGNFERLRSALWHLTLPASALVEDAWSDFKNQLLTQQSSFIPNWEKRPNNTKNPPWFHIEINRALKMKNNLHTLMKTICWTENTRL